MSSTRKAEPEEIPASAVVETAVPASIAWARGEPEPVTCSIRAHWKDSEAPSLEGSAVVEEGVLLLSVQDFGPHRVHYELRRGALGTSDILHLTLRDVTGGVWVLCRIDAALPQISLATDDGPALALGFGWDEDSIQVARDYYDEASRAAEAVLCSDQAGGLTPELIVALDIITLVQLFRGAEHDWSSLDWPEGPRKAFHHFMCRLMVARTREVG